MTDQLFPRFTGFTYQPVLGGYEEGITRRDPSPVIKYNGKYYVWYSRSTEANHGYTATIWYATSDDGINWTEQKQALSRGSEGTFDEHAVFTPSILVHEGKYYLSYTAVAEPFYNIFNERKIMISKTAIGMAVASTPDGPWEKIPEPILKPTDNPALFDSLRVDDSCFVTKENKVYMYYKGRQIDHTPQETKMGLAIADRPEGPYIRYSDQPIVKGGHEVCCWPHKDGIAALFCNVGEAGNSLQYSEDGIHFTKICDTVPPMAPGPYREDNYKEGRGKGISWGLCISNHKKWPSLARFECDLTV